MTTDTNKPQPPKRHWCFVAWLVWAIVSNVGVAYFRPTLVFYCVVNLILTGGLYKWRLWGFWGFSVIAGVMFLVQLSDGVGILRSTFVFVSVAILYGVLQIGGERKAWNYLR